VVGKQDGTGFTRDVGVPEEEVFRKQDGASCNRNYGESEDDVVRKQDGAVTLRIRTWPQDCNRVDWNRKRAESCQCRKWS